MNNIVLVGRLTEDPKVTECESGIKVTYITVAVSRNYKNVDGVYETDFIRCVLWNAIAENTTEFCKCGDVIGIKGRLQTSSYEDSDGTKKYTMEVVAERVTFLSSKQSTISNEPTSEKTIDEQDKIKPKKAKKSTKAE